MPRRLAFLSLVFALVFFSGSARAQSTSFSYTTIDFPSGTNTRTNGINARGDIVGRYEDGSGAHGFVLSQGIFTTLVVAGTANDEDGPARGINARGDSVGQ